MVLNVLPSDGEESSEGGSGSSSESGSGCGSGGGSCGNGLEKVYPNTAIRFGEMRRIGEFSHHAKMKFTCGAKVVIQTKRGIEIGEQVSLSCGGCSSSVTREQILNYVAASGPDYYELECGRILREATPDDLREHERMQGTAREKRRICQNAAEQYGLAMKIVQCEPLFGGERIIFYFTSEGRVDFRSLVKDLAKEFQTRIEMRQVGARDEARLVADFETCGRECCCKNFLKNLKQVSMKMAKLQKATLDPSKVSGRCGRLKCCLRYEHTSYEELDKKLPRMGKRVWTEHGEGTVVGRQILTQLLQVAVSDGGRFAVGIEELLPPGTAPTKPTPVPTPPPVSRGTKPDAKPDKPASTDEESARPARRNRRRRRPEGEAAKTERPVRPGEAPPATPSVEPRSDVAAPASEEGQKKKRRRRRRRPKRSAEEGKGQSSGDGPPQSDKPGEQPEN